MLFNMFSILFKIINKNLNGITIEINPKIIIVPIKKLTKIFDNKNVKDILLNITIVIGNINICTERDIAIISFIFVHILSNKSIFLVFLIFSFSLFIVSVFSNLNLSI